MYQSSVFRFRIALAREEGFTYYMAHRIIMRGWDLIEQGQGKGGIGQMRQGLADYRATGASVGRHCGKASEAGGLKYGSLPLPALYYQDPFEGWCRPRRRYGFHQPRLPDEPRLQAARSGTAVP
jgi:hypothetical protein